MLLTMFDADANVRSSRVIGRGIYRWGGRRTSRARANLQRSFPEFAPHKREQVLRASFEHFTQLVLEVIHTPRIIHPDTWSRRVSITHMGQAIQLLNTGRPVLMVTGHLGNWEVLGYLLAVLGYHVHAIARPIDNPLINQWLLGIREKRGMEIITKWDATERMMQVIDAGEPLAFIADQNAGERGLFVPFFGRMASTYKSVGLLAIRRELPIICGYAHRVGPDCRYELGTQDIIYPHQWQEQDDPLYYITARYMRAIENMVRLRPAQYLWMHRRWKSRPRWEKAGKPMPANVIRQLEALPWMDQPQMDRLLAPTVAEFA